MKQIPLSKIADAFINDIVLKIHSIITENFYGQATVEVSTDCFVDAFTYQNTEGLWITIPVEVHTSKHHNSNKIILFSNGKCLGVVDSNGTEYVTKEYDSKIIHNIELQFENNIAAKNSNIAIQISYLK